MKRISWACFKAAALGLALWASVAALAAPLQPLVAGLLEVQSTEPPAAHAPWRDVELPHATGGFSAWYRLQFEVPARIESSWAVYLPYFNGGGQLLLNGVPLAHIPITGGGKVIRWERPFLLPIPDALLKTGTVNVLLLRIHGEAGTRHVRMALPQIGPQADLLAAYEQRRFWVRTMPHFTVLACVMVGLLVLFIWWRRREELLYGLFGLAALLWGGRTLTFIVEVLPAGWWIPWRLIYHSATGGFIVVLMMFSMRLAGVRKPWAERALLGYWLLGPVVFVLSGGNEALLGRVWSAGLIFIGLGLLIASSHAAWHQRTLATVSLCLGLGVAVLAGVHDYLMAGSAPFLQSIVPHWAQQRIFLLHYAADLLLLIMGSILGGRFIAALQDIEHLNRTLESRVAEREQALASNYQELGRLERQHAADDERQRIMRDLHDGLGSQLFVTLSRVEAGELSQGATAQALRDCIADMRLALEAMSPDNNDFLEAWSNFRFRWERQLETAGLQSTWSAQTEDGVLNLAPQPSLQLLRIAQEALTNVLKHAGAARVDVRLVSSDAGVRLEITDDGRGVAASSGTGGRGLANMRARTQRLGGQFAIHPANPGTLVRVDLAAV